ncbi:MAG: peptidase domain-containing ABC transporter [Tahibacter sp.]
MTSPLLRRFPGLARLWRGERVPFVAQSAPGECGVACLAMLACHYGRATGVAEVSAMAGASRLGSRLGELAALAPQLGFAARIVKLHELDELRWLDRPVMLHWRFCHFVILLSFDGRRAQLLDPASGAIEVDRLELEEAYTGLLLWPDAPPQRAAKAPHRPVLPFLRGFVDAMPELPALLTVCLGLQLLSLIPAMLSAWLFGTVLPRHDGGLAAALAVAALTVATLQPLFELVRNYLVVQLRGVLGLAMLTELVDRVLRIPWKLLQQRPYGDILTRLHANEEIRSLLTGSGVALLLDGVLALMAMAILLVTSAACAAVVIGCVAVASAVFATLRRQRAHNLAELFAGQSQSQGYLVQMLMGMETVRASGLDRGVRQRWSTLFARETSAVAALGRTEGRIAALATALTQSSGLLVLLVAGRMSLAGSLTLTQALLTYSLALTALGALGRLLLGIQHLQSVGFQVALAQDLLELPCMPESSEDRSAPAATASRGTLRCANVSFAHAANQPATLTDIALDIPTGGLIALVGPSGSGKSTLLSILAGLYVPDQGEIELDGRALATFDPAALRRRIVLVPQFPYFFAQSIRENLQLARADASPAQMRDAAARACIAADIDALPMAYETVLAEGGSGLSGGQRQRLALARAILAAPDVLLLDEATSSLDAQTEQSVLAELASLACTRVIAAHRLSTVRAADYIYVLDAGRIVQHGSYAQLAHQTGPFRRLFNRQLGDADAA